MRCYERDNKYLCRMIRMLQSWTFYETDLCKSNLFNLVTESILSVANLMIHQGLRDSKILRQFYVST